MRRFLILSLLLTLTLPVHASWFVYYQQQPAPTSPSQPAPSQPAPSQPAPSQPAPQQPTNWSSGWGWSQPAPQPAPTPAPQPAPTKNTQIPVLPGIAADEARMVSLLNQERVAAGLKPLVVDSQLTLLARVKSQDMVDHNYFAHRSPRLGMARDLLNTYNVPHRIVGENLASGGNAVSNHYRLMASPDHRRNILYPQYTHVGVGVVPHGAGIMVTQIFIQR